MNLLNDNIKKLYLKFLIPSLGSAMVMSVYTLTDAIVIGKGVGADALAALSFTTPLLCISLLRNVLLSGIGIIVMPGIWGGNVLWMIIPIVEVCVMFISAVMLYWNRNISDNTMIGY